MAREAYRALNVKEELSSSADGAHDLLRAMVGEGLVEGCEGTDARVRALDITVVDHDVPEDLRGVQPLEPAVAAVILVGRKAPVAVLQRQKHVRSIVEALGREVRDLAISVFDAVQFLEPTTEMRRCEHAWGGGNDH